MTFEEYYKLNEECRKVTVKLYRLNPILNSYPEDLDLQEYVFKLKNLHFNLTQTMEAQNELKKPCLTEFLNGTYLPHQFF
uniref:Uncharacterized protein n=1 Tax=Panagrolaimus sp. PS1159 TaxID=55785 RepID=A0AC35GXG9_9BILA